MARMLALSHSLCSLLASPAAVSTASAPGGAGSSGLVDYRMGRRYMDFTFNYMCWPPPHVGHGLLPGDPNTCFCNMSDSFAQDFVQQFVDMSVDSALVEAVPDSGWATYPSEYAPIFPQLARRGIDWLGAMTTELRRRGITPYIYINVRSSAAVVSPPPWGQGHTEWTWENQNGTGSPDTLEEGGKICFNAPGRIDQLVNLTKEVIRLYHPAAVRYDGFYVTYTDCRTEGDKAFWREVFNEPMPSQWAPDRSDWPKIMQFYRATNTRLLRRLREAALSVDPSVHTWFNGVAQARGDWVSPEHWIDMDAAFNYTDVAFIEFGGSGGFWPALLEGATDPSHGVINGCLLYADPAVHGSWEAVANGNIMYQYLNADFAKGGPDPGEGGSQIPAFFHVMSEVEEFLQDSSPLRLGCMVFSEKTRFRYSWYDRTTYVQGLEALFNTIVQAYSIGVRVESAINLERSRLLRRCPAVVVMESSGLNASAVAELVAYASLGGKLVATGDALLYDAAGARRADFDAAGALGVSFVRTTCIAENSTWERDGAPGVPSSPSCVNVVVPTTATVAAGLTVRRADGTVAVACPLITRQALGAGSVTYLSAKYDNSIGGGCCDGASSNLTAGLAAELLLAATGGEGALPYRVHGSPRNRSEVVVTTAKGAARGGRVVVYFLHGAPTDVTLSAAALHAGARVAEARSWFDNGTVDSTFRVEGTPVAGGLRIRASCPAAQGGFCVAPYRLAVIGPAAPIAEPAPE